MNIIKKIEKKQVSYIFPSGFISLSWKWWLTFSSFSLQNIYFLHTQNRISWCFMNGNVIQFPERGRNKGGKGISNWHPSQGTIIVYPDDPWKTQLRTIRAVIHILGDMSYLKRYNRLVADLLQFEATREMPVYFIREDIYRLSDSMKQYVGKGEISVDMREGVLKRLDTELDQLQRVVASRLGASPHVIQEKKYTTHKNIIILNPVPISDGGQREMIQTVFTRLGIDAWIEQYNAMILMFTSMKQMIEDSDIDISGLEQAFSRYIHTLFLSSGSFQDASSERKREIWEEISAQFQVFQGEIRNIFGIYLSEKAW